MWSYTGVYGLWTERLWALGTYVLVFIYFSSLIAVTRTSTTMSNNSGKSGHPCFVPDLRGDAFRFSPLRIMFAVGLSYMDFTMLR